MPKSSMGEWGGSGSSSSVPHGNRAAASGHSPSQESGHAAPPAASIFGIDTRLIREAWGRVHFTNKMFLLSLVCLGLIIACLGVLLSIEARDIDAIKGREGNARFFKQLGRVYVALEDEAAASVGNARWALSGGRDEAGNSVPQPVSRAAMLKAQLATDLAMQSLLQPAMSTPLASSILRQLFRSTVLADTRQKINYATLTGAQLQPRRADYNVLLRDVANAMLRVSQSLTSPHVQSQLAVQSALACVASHYAVDALAAGRDVIRMGPLIGVVNTSTNANTSSSSPFESHFHQQSSAFLHAAYRTETMARLLMGAGAGGAVLAYQDSRTALTRAPWQLIDALGAGSGGGIWRSPPINLSSSSSSSPSGYGSNSGWSPERNALVAYLISRLPDGAFTDISQSSEHASEVVYGLLVALCCVTLVYMFGCWLLHRRSTETNEVTSRNASIMHAIMLRVSEFSEAFATFSLVVPPPPALLRPQRAGQLLEAELQQCLASLRVLAPTMPPLMFPTYFAKMAAAVGEVNDSRTVADRITDTIAPRDDANSSQRRGTIHLLTPDDLSPLRNAYCAPMRALTALSARLSNAVVMTVDAFFFHDVCQPQRRQGHVTAHQHAMTQLQRERWAHHALQRVATCVEACVYAYGGVVHFIGLDRIIAVWMVDPCAAAAAAGGGSSGAAAHSLRGSGHHKGASRRRGRSAGDSDSLLGDRRGRHGGGGHRAYSAGGGGGGDYFASVLGLGGGDGGAEDGGDSLYSSSSQKGAAAGGGGLRSVGPRIGVYGDDEYRRLLSAQRKGSAGSSSSSHPLGPSPCSSSAPNGGGAPYSVRITGGPPNHHHHHHSGEGGDAAASGGVPSSALLDGSRRASPSQPIINMRPFLQPTLTPIYSSRSLLASGAEGAGLSIASLFGGGGGGGGSSRRANGERDHLGGLGSEQRLVSGGGSASLGGIHTVPRHHQRMFRAPNACDAPAMCALACAARLADLRRASSGGIHDPCKLWASLPIHIGVTAGPVMVGTFGAEGNSNSSGSGKGAHKTVQLLGDALTNGLAVARVNQHALTSVVCDELVRRVIETHRFCKPVDTLPVIGRVYEIIPPAVAAQEADVEAKLAAFRAAYYLYEGKFYREALRAFRAYTKQYGYDRSVERLQGVITGL